VRASRIYHNEHLLNDITNIENDTEVIFVHAFSHLRKKLEILISVASFFGKFENVLWVAFLIQSDTLSLVKYPVLIKPNILLLLY
jgi:hypothetical protein